MSRHSRGQSSFRGTLLSRRSIAKRRSAIGVFPFRRRLHIEPLEDRRLLATITVDTLADGVGVPGTSLREAIAAANPNDSIDFAVTGTIQLIGTGDLVINKPLTIQGPGQSLLTIQAYDFGPGAGNGSSIFFIGDLDNGVQFDVEISGLTLTGGDTIGRGGAIRCTESLVLGDCTITGNSAVSQGGGIYFRYGDLIVSRCTITGNTSGLGGGIMAVNSTTLVENSLITNNQSVNPGGGIHSLQSNMVVNNTTISGNSASGTEGGGGINEGGGGGIRSYQGNLEITGSTISGNMALVRTDGGGVDFNHGILAITDSTISGNSGHDGGGIHIFLAGTQTATITNSTISGNTASEESGGINCEGGITIIRHSTITNNTGSFAGGLLHRGYNGSTTQIHSTIISGNTGTDVVEFIDAGGGPLVSNGYNLIGTTNVPAKFNQPGDQVGVTNPMLAPLANNGGRTLTHLVLPGSPALDAGNPAFAAPPSNDQRGAPFVRVFDGDSAGGARIDIGAFELQPAPPGAIGDFNDDNAMDAADYVMWRKLVGMAGVPPYSGADGDGDGMVDPGDYGVWRTNFGETLAGSGGEQTAASVEGEGNSGAGNKAKFENPKSDDGTLIVVEFFNVGTTAKDNSRIAMHRPDQRIESTYDAALMAWLDLRDAREGDEWERDFIGTGGSDDGDVDEIDRVIDLFRGLIETDVI
jgi:CSLREA domain-containing protein